MAMFGCRISRVGDQFIVVAELLASWHIVYNGDCVSIYME